MELPAVEEVRARLAASDVTAPTRRALIARQEAPDGKPRTFDAAQIGTLRAVASRLVPLNGLHLAERLDAQLATGPGAGWRYADMPPHVEAHRRGLDALAAVGFGDMEPAAQDELLLAVRRGKPPGGPWPFSAERWFEEMLTALVRLAYAHPATQMAIGYDGFADARGQLPAA